MAESNVREQTQKDAQAVAQAAKTAQKVASKLAKKAAGKAAGKAAAKAVGSTMGAGIKTAIAAGIGGFLTFIIQVALLVILPASVVGSVSSMVTDAAENLAGWFDEVQTSFSASAIAVFESIDDFFDNVYAFFTGDNTEDEIDAQIQDILTTAGRNTEGEETSYGNSLDGEVTICYKYYLDEYVEAKRSVTNTSPGIVDMGNDYISAHQGELPTQNSSNTVTNADGSTTTTNEVYDTSTIGIQAVYEGDDMGDFFKPVFYLLASDSLTQYDNHSDEYAMDSLVILAHDTADNLFEVFPSEPTAFIENVSSDSSPDFWGNTTITNTHTYSVNVPYRIGTSANSIENIITIAGNDPVEDEEVLKANVENSCHYFGAELEPDAGEDGWGLINFVDTPLSSAGGAITSPLSPEQVAQALANIDLTGCNDGAQAVMNIIRNIDTYARVSDSESPIQGVVRLKENYCQRAIADIYMCAGFSRPSFNTALSTLNGPGSVRTSDSPPCSGYAVVGTSPTSSAGHIAVYFKTADGGEYIVESVGAQIQINTFAAWKQYYGYQGYTNFGLF